MIDQELLNAGVEVAKLLCKGVLTAATLAALSWGTVEWVLPAFIGVHAPKCPSCGGSDAEGLKRGVAFFTGLGVVFLAHWTNTPSYGPGPQGWGTALLFGFLGGGLAPYVHAWIQKHLPVLTNPANGSATA